jgi:gag-polyprotein putative aspartyl protease
LSQSSSAVPETPESKSEVVKDTKALFIEGTIEGMSASCLVDTGATISIIGRNVWKQLLAYSTNIREEKTRSKAYAANNQPLSILCAAELTVVFGTQSINHRFTVVDETLPEVVLGMDFLNKHLATISFESKNARTRNGKLLSLKEKEDVHRSVRVVNEKQCIIKPKHAVILSAVVKGELDGKSLIMEPNRVLMEKQGVLIARAVVANQHTVPVKVINTSGRPITLYKGQTLGMVDEADIPSEEEVPVIENDNVRLVKDCNEEDDAEFNRFIKQTLGEEGPEERK